MNRVGSVAALLLTVGVLLMAAPGHSAAPARAAHTYADGDCWKSGTPLWCRRTWRQGEYVFVRLIDRFSDVQPNWRDAAEAARSRWSIAAGPQSLSFVARTNDTWVYLHDAGNREHGLRPNVGAITWNCDVNRYCSPYNEPMNVWWTDIYFNRDDLDDYPQFYQNVFAHEYGHAVGLFHHPDPERLMNNYPTGIEGPTDPGDIGRSSSCSIEDEGGVRCIYRWTRD